MESPDQHPEQEGFGEASLGEAQATDPPLDPEMIDESANPTPDDGDAPGDPGGEGDGSEG